jgi:hypothetical protein
LPRTGQIVIISGVVWWCGRVVVWCCGEVWFFLPILIPPQQKLFYVVFGCLLGCGNLCTDYAIHHSSVVCSLVVIRGYNVKSQSLFGIDPKYFFVLKVGTGPKSIFFLWLGPVP